MMNFALLTEARQASSEHTDKRQEVYLQNYRQGLAALRLFHRHGSLGDLQLAVEHLLKASRNSRSQVEPYVWLAYALLISGSARLGCVYLRQARSLDAGHPLVLALEQSLSQTR